MKQTLLLLMTLLFACCSSDSEAKAETANTTGTMTMNITIDGTCAINSLYIQPAFSAFAPDGHSSLWEPLKKRNTKF